MVHAIYIKVLSDGIMSYMIVSTYYVLDTTNKETAFPELRNFLNNLLVLNPKEVMCLST